MGRIIVSAKADYALRSVLELALAGEPLNAETIAARQAIPLPFLRRILAELQTAEIIVSRRGFKGGHRLTRGADEITIADVLRAVEATVPERAPATDDGFATRLNDVWSRLRTRVRSELEHITLADLLIRSE